MEKENLRFGLVGCGHIGERHASLISALGQLVIVCDIEHTKAQVFSEKYQCKMVTSYREMIENADQLDIMVVCTPNWLHAPQSIEALDCGLHVICEKPMALNVSDANQMIEAAQRNQKILWIVKQNRFNPPVAYLKNLIETGKLGKIYSIQIQGLWNRNVEYYSKSNWKGTIEKDGGILFTQFSHFIDVACWLFGKMESLSTNGGNLAHQGIIEFDDTITCLVKFDKGVLGCLHFSINAFGQNMEGSITVLGEKGSVSIGGPYLNKLNYHLVEGATIPELEKENPVNDYGYYKGSMNNHKKVYQHFIESLSAGNWMHSELDNSLNTIEAISELMQNLQDSNILVES